MKTVNKIKDDSTGFIITKKYGQNIFRFSVGEIFTNQGSKKFVFVEQETKWNQKDFEIFGMFIPNAITNWKFYFDILTTEYGAINLAGKKLIKDWKNI
jgi:hypothetical protein